MYTHIEPYIGIVVVQPWLVGKYAGQLPEVIPITLVISALRLMKTRNVFHFDDIFWLHFIRTLMGIPRACIYTMAVYGHHVHKEGFPHFDSSTLPACWW
jgi:hypothetical protein